MLQIIYPTLHYTLVTDYTKFTFSVILNLFYFCKDIRSILTPAQVKTARCDILARFPTTHGLGHAAQ